MEYRALGSSGLRISVLTMGTMTFGGRGGFASVGSTDVDQARRQVDICLEAGVNLIDTADVPSHMEYQAPAGFSVSLSGDDSDALRGYFEQLSVGGTVTMPLQKQVWGDEFGMCVDQFGISWLANISQPQM